MPFARTAGIIQLDAASQPYEPQRVCSVRQACTVHLGRAFFGRGEGERQLVPLEVRADHNMLATDRWGRPFSRQRPARSRSSPWSLATGSGPGAAPNCIPVRAPPTLPSLSMITYSAPVIFADPSPQVIEGGLRSSTRSFSCSPRSRVLLLKLSCCLRPLV